MPDFLIIGAAKSGTTSLYFYLQQHPQIFMPYMKEPFFFAFQGQELQDCFLAGKMKENLRVVTTLEQYQALFADAPVGSMVGEASTLYLYQPNAAARIKEQIPNVKLIVVLRNPVDRAYSHYQHFVRDGYEPEADFYSAILAEKIRMQQNWFPSYFYFDAGFYSVQLKRYYDLFPKEQIKVFLYEDLQDAEKMTKEIFAFFGLNTDLKIDTGTKHNLSGDIRFPALYRSVKHSAKIKPFLRRLMPVKAWSRLRAYWEKWIIRPVGGMDEEVREELQTLFREDILSLQGLIDRDLSSWLL
jgi:hypothetical protein